MTPVIMHMTEINQFYFGRIPLPWASATKVGVAPWIFIHDKDIVDRGLIVLFFGLFSVAPILEIFLPTPLTPASAKIVGGFGFF